MVTSSFKLVRASITLSVATLFPGIWISYGKLVTTNFIKGVTIIRPFNRLWLIDKVRFQILAAKGSFHNKFVVWFLANGIQVKVKFDISFSESLLLDKAGSQQKKDVSDHTWYKMYVSLWL